MASKRRWFQIHLSTAIVLMFVAGIFIWRNCQPHTWGTLFSPKPDQHERGVQPYDSRVIQYGWPNEIWVDQLPNAQQDWRYMNTEVKLPSQSKQVLYGKLLINLLDLFLLCAGIAFFLEFLIRRRERKRAQ